MTSVMRQKDKFKKMSLAVDTEIWFQFTRMIISWLPLKTMILLVANVFVKPLDIVEMWDVCTLDFTEILTPLSMLNFKY